MALRTAGVLGSPSRPSRYRCGRCHRHRRPYPRRRPRRRPRRCRHRRRHPHPRPHRRPRLRPRRHRHRHRHRRPRRGRRLHPWPPSSPGPSFTVQPSVRTDIRMAERAMNRMGAPGSVRRIASDGPCRPAQQRGFKSEVAHAAQSSETDHRRGRRLISMPGSSNSLRLPDLEHQRGPQ